MPLDVEELADLRLFAEALVKIAQDGTHRACFCGLASHLAVHDASAAGRVDGLQLLRVGVQRGEDEGGEEGQVQEDALLAGHFSLVLLVGDLEGRSVPSTVECGGYA